MKILIFLWDNFGVKLVFIVTEGKWLRRRGEKEVSDWKFSLRIFCQNSDLVSGHYIYLPDSGPEATSY